MENMSINRALSREGHAAMSMRGGDDRWILIQKNTFTNWVNEQLRNHGLPPNEFVKELVDDFDDGIRLCALIEELQGKKIGKVIKKPLNHHQNLENVTLALTAIANDNVRLVNIGSEDIVNGSLKLILGLIWHLILRYQIGKTKFPAKKLMLAWLNAVIPECSISNFTRDWNDGTALHALIEYCQPGLSPNWRYMSKSDAVGNCKTAMDLAYQHFGIPLVVRAEDLASPDLDELSGMTYLSYFMKIDSPGYTQTRSIVRRLIKGRTFDNFTDDWADGTLLCALTSSLGERASPDSDPQTSLQNGIDAARKLGVEPVLTAKEMCDPEVDHIGIMAYAAYFLNFRPVITAAEKVVMDTQPKNCYINQQSTFVLRIEDSSLSPGDVRAECKGPDSNPAVYFSWNDRTATGKFTATEVGQHRMNVYCENSMIVGCPVSFRVLADRSQVSFHGVEKCSVGQISELVVDASRAGQGDIQCEARTPSGRIQNINAVYRNGRYVMNFSPSEIGIYQVSVLYDGDHISGSPFNVKVNDPTRVRVFGLDGGSVGTGLRFNADTSESGDGDLQVVVTYQGNTVPSYVHQERIGLYSIDFTPQGPGSYRTEVFFSGVEVRGSPYITEIVDSSKVTVSGDGITLVPVGRTASFNVDTQSSSGKLDIEITAPMGDNVPFNIRQNNGDQTVEYVPGVVGDHTISVKYNDSHVEGSPFIAKAYDSSAIYITPLRNTLVGKPVCFTIDVSKAGEGQLEIMVNNGNLPNKVELERPNVYKIEFTPITPGRQYVDINFNGEAVRLNGQTEGSALTCLAVDGTGVTITGMDDCIPASHETSFNIRCETDDDMRPEVEVFSPNGSTVPARLVSQSGGNFRVEWTPRDIGRHRVEVVFGGRQIDGSPFNVDVFDLLSIRVDNFNQKGIGEPAGFEIDLSAAGNFEPNVRIVSPYGNNVPISTSNEYGNRRGISYIPEESGEYRIFITYVGFELPGCPFIQNIDDGGMPEASGDGLYRGEEDKIATFFVDIGNRKGNLEVRCDGPNSIAKTNVEPNGDRFIVTYIPVEVGVYDLEIKWNGKEIPGSPFHPRVIDPRKVKIYGGWQSYFDAQERVRLVVGEEKRLVFDVSQAGPGTMRAEVKGPNTYPRDYVDTSTVGQNVVCFTPQEQGNHYIHLFWGDSALPNSPFIGYATPVYTDAKVILTGRGLKEAKVREQAEFIIDGSQAGPGLPSVTLTGLKAEITNKVVPLGGGKFHCTYTPLVPGAYLLNITWNDRPLRGSPYKVNVVGSFYPKKVSVTGPGLKGGMVNSTMEVLIDVRNAGPGELTASCVGPEKIALCNLHDNRDGTFTLSIVPKETGKHVLQVKYGGEHVQGSPFVFKVVSRPDASKVRVTGPGVEHGILAHFKSTFNVETGGAGAGQLNVKIRGPKGGFLVEMIRDSQKDRRIECRYDPSETGDYEIHVKWSGEHVPGSPFLVKIFDTHQELENYIRNPQRSLSYQSDSSYHHHHREGSFPSSYSAPRTMNFAQWKAEI